ncbi:MAG: murein L,D-transpeptidase YcbB/YkuD [Flavobacteriaceae bacterium]|jgi:murein L,D-transpeptidase YcbB/YkuD
MYTLIKPLLHIVLLSVILIGCTDPAEESDGATFENQDIPVSEKIKTAINKEYIATLGMDESALDYLYNFYNARDFKPVWSNDSCLTAVGEKLKVILRKPEQLGVPQGRHAKLTGENYIQDELINTYLTARVNHDLENGIIDFEAKKRKPVGYLSKERLNDYVNLNDDSDIRHQFLALGPSDSSYIILSKGLMHLMDNYPMDTSIFEVHTIKKDTIESHKRATAALISKGYLTVDNDTSELFIALREFQTQSGLKPDAVIGKYTSRALNESTVHRRDRIILAMDKIRAREAFPTKYIHINIPEYKLRFYINDSLKSDHNIVVGKSGNETPELTSKLKHIIAYPFWNVPYSISSEEILPAVKYNVDYLANHDYKIYKDGKEVDPTTVNWSKIGQRSFPYKVVQGPGRRNSLGIIKFVFPNSHSVYFHDTPSKSLFSADVRAYSHGCMRTQNPVQLAEAILERDQLDFRENDIIVDSLDSIMVKAVRRDIKLIDPIPIFIEYITVARRGDEMITYIDIYGRDEEYLKIMRE